MIRALSCGVAAALALAAFETEAAPVRTYVFTQGGYPGGGAVAGYFTGADEDRDGRLTSGRSLRPNELSDFQFSFSGNSEHPSFSFGGRGGGISLDYELGESSMTLAFMIYDGRPGLHPYGTYRYDGDDARGKLLTYIEMGNIYVPDTVYRTETSLGLHVVEVPLPATGWLIAAAAGLLIGAGRKSRSVGSQA